MLTRLEDLRLALFDESLEHPEVGGIDDAIKQFIERLYKARYLFCAIRQSPRRKISGTGGALERMQPPVGRSTAYKILEEELGFADPDKFRDCETMVDVIREGDVLREKLFVLDAEYVAWSRENGDRSGWDGRSLCDVLGIDQPSLAHAR